MHCSSTWLRAGSVSDRYALLLTEHTTHDNKLTLPLQGGENYQKSFYVFEELAQAPSSASATSLIAQAVSELHMGRIEEAETALGQALTLEPENSTAIANKFVLDTISGKDASEARAKLQSVNKESEILADLDSKREAFQAAMAKYSPKFEP